jgi:hypothetical protein
MATTGAVVARIISQYSDKGSKQAQKDISKLGKNIDAFGKKATKAFGLAATGAALLAIKIGKDSVKAAIEETSAQAVLANTLRNVAGATDATIKSVEDYIDKQEMLSTVSDTELRASFGRLVAVSGDVTESMRLQTIALDVAAGTTTSFNTVSKAFEKASAGKFEALRKVLPGIDESIIKTKNLGAAEAYAAKMYGGAAKKFGDTQPLAKLSIAFGRVKEALGIALLPVVKEFAEYIVSDVIPQLTRWIEANEGRLQASLRDTAQLIKDVMKDSERFLAVLIRYEAVVKTLAIAFAGVYTSIKLLGAVIGVLEILRKLRTMKITFGLSRGAFKTLGEIKTFAGMMKAFSASKFITGLKLINVALITMEAKAWRAAAAVAFATGGASLLTAGIAIAAVAITYGALNYALKENKKSADELAASMERAKKFPGLPDIGVIQEKSRQDAIALQAAKDKAKADQIAAAAAAKDAAATKRQADAEKLREKVLARLKKLSAVPGKGQPKIGKGITPVSTLEAAEYEAINFRAAELLLIKQKDNQAELEKLKALKENVFLQGLRNTLSERYKDILIALADAKIDSKDIATLAGKWGVTIEAAKAYIETVFAISDGTIDDEEITNLAKSWGSTKAQAAQYLDFFTYLNDGILSDAEIEKLKTKWKLTEDQVRQYADFVGVVNDGKLEDSEIKKLMSKWKMTTDEVVAYILKIGSPVSYSESLLTPAQAAELAWKNATKALEEFLRKQAAAGGPSSGGYTYDPAASADANKEAADAAAALIEATAAEAAANSAATEAAIDAANKVIALVTTLDLKKASGRSYLTDAEMDRVLTASNSPYAPTASSTGFDDERSKFINKYGLSPTIATASTMGTSSSSSGVVVNLTVNGSVSTEQDLVSAVRNGLLATQTNGNTLTLQAV